MNVAALAALVAFTAHTPATALDDHVAAQACSAIAARVDAIAGSAPVFLRSYDDADGGEPKALPLHTAAFVYDNALATIALLACGKPAQAARIGEALRLAAMQDSRLRNVYRAGVVGDKVLPNGWWDDASQRWLEDPYQCGTATGNVAWAALAMAALGEHTQRASWFDAAQHLATWVVDNTTDTRGAGGFSGGVNGFDNAPMKLQWKSTEHNIDLAALFERLPPQAQWLKQKAHARAFLASQWEPTQGRFLIGTLADGVTENYDSSALDAQLWPFLLRDAPQEWTRALDYAVREHGIDAGFDFNADRDGVWLEGTAQAALVDRHLGRSADANRALALLATQFAPGGFVYATREPRITTGLAVGPGSASSDFYYYRLPHLAATAWTALAALGWNPLAGRSVLR